jgi:hypothetical protein
VLEASVNLRGAAATRKSSHSDLTLFVNSCRMRASSFRRLPSNLDHTLCLSLSRGLSSSFKQRHTIATNEPGGGDEDRLSETFESNRAGEASRRLESSRRKLAVIRRCPAPLTAMVATLVFGLGSQPISTHADGISSSSAPGTAEYTLTTTTGLPAPTVPVPGTPIGQLGTITSGSNAVV